jgi:indolepyruvate ferredoxin oxidoreductase, beta subunit
MTTTRRPVTILIAAMGGEGGGVLADWIISAATALDYPVQSTSIPGVAQRTGATTYYLEVFPQARAELQGDEPVLSLTPTPGHVDIVAASELVEAGRMLQGGYVSPRRTVLVASTHREYAVFEKMAMSDGRYDGQRVLDAAPRLAQRSVLFDMRELALRHGTVINTVMFGAMVGVGTLPLARSACEEAIRASGKAVEASLRGFAAGFEWAERGSPAASGVGASRTPQRTAWPARVAALPQEVRDVVAAGVDLTSDYQDSAYAELYLDRIEALCAQRPDAGTACDAVREAARYLALWMAYEDVIRVADLKTRRERLARVRKEVGARDDEPMALSEFLKPGLDELCSILPSGLARWTRLRLARHAQRLAMPLQLRTHTVAGFALLCGLRSLRPLRRRMSRYAQEQVVIERWLSHLRAALPDRPALALELALCGNLVKGYGETHERGHRSLATILTDIESGAQADAPALAARVKQARTAALDDPEGRALAGALGLPKPEPVAKPIRIVPRIKRTDINPAQDHPVRHINT